MSHYFISEGFSLSVGSFGGSPEGFLEGASSSGIFVVESLSEMFCAKLTSLLMLSLIFLIALSLSVLVPFGPTGGVDGVDIVVDIVVDRVIDDVGVVLVVDDVVLVVVGIGVVDVVEVVGVWEGVGVVGLVVVCLSKFQISQLLQMTEINEPIRIKALFSNKLLTFIFITIFFR